MNTADKLRNLLQTVREKFQPNMPEAGHMNIINMTGQEMCEWCRDVDAALAPLEAQEPGSMPPPIHQYCPNDLSGQPMNIWCDLQSAETLEIIKARIAEYPGQCTLRTLYAAPASKEAEQEQGKPAVLAHAEVGKGPVASFVRLTDAGRAMPPGRYDLFAVPKATAHQHTAQPAGSKEVVAYPEPIPTLLKFYNVVTLDALVVAQSWHIEKLQEKLQPDSQPAYTNVPEG